MIPRRSLFPSRDGRPPGAATPPRFRRRGLVAALVTTTLLALPGLAQGATGSIGVEVQGPGRVVYNSAKVAERIDCPGDCSGTFSYDDANTPMPQLEATVPNGYVLDWTGCAEQPSATRCRVGLIESETAPIVAAFRDVVAPSVRWATPSPAAGQRYGGTQSVIAATAEVTDNGPLDRVELLMDGQPIGVDRSAPYLPQATNADWRRFADGPHQIALRAVDAAGNSALTPELTVVLDTVAPKLRIVGGPAYGAITNELVLTYVFEQLEPGFVKCGFGLDTGVIPIGPCTSPTSYTIAPPTDGGYWVGLTNADDLGNRQDYPYRLTIDRTAPGLALGGAPTGVTRATTYTVEATVTDLHPDTLDCRLDDGPGQSDCRPARGTVGDGPHRLRVTATDKAGNATTKTATWTVDASGPTTTFTAGPAPGARVPVGEVAFAWATPTDPTGVDQVLCAWDGATAAACQGRAARTLAAGEHQFALTLVDVLGNRTTLERRFVVSPDGGGGGPDPRPGGGTPDPGAGGGPAPGPGVTDVQVIDLGLPPSGAPGGTPPSPSGVAPKVRLTAARSVRAGSLRSGLRVTVRCSTSAAGTLTLSGPGGLRVSRPLRCAKAKALRVTVPITARQRSRVRSGARLRLTAKLTDAAQRSGTGSATVSVRR